MASQDHTDALGAQGRSLKGLLACPSCRHSPLEFQADAVLCGACQARYPVEEGIVDLVVSQGADDIPAFYRDATYQKFISGLGAVHEAHYKPGSLSARLEGWMKKDLATLMSNPVFPVVDLGCGGGSGFDQFGGAQNIIGVDSDMGLLRRARSLFPRATLVRAALEKLPFRDGCMRTVVANAVIEHVYHLERTMQEVARCLAPDGKFYVMVPTEGGLAVGLARLVTSQRNAAAVGLTAVQSRHAQRIDHCNTVFAIENAMRKHFKIFTTKAWPLRLGGNHFNLVKSFRLEPLESPRS